MNTFSDSLSVAAGLVAHLDPKLAEMILVKNSRLSVQPVTDEEYFHICKRCGLDNPPKSP